MYGYAVASSIATNGNEPCDLREVIPATCPSIKSVVTNKDRDPAQRGGNVSIVEKGDDLTSKLLQRMSEHFCVAGAPPQHEQVITHGADLQ